MVIHARVAAQAIFARYFIRDLSRCVISGSTCCQQLLARSSIVAGSTLTTDARRNCLPPRSVLIPLAAPLWGASKSRSEQKGLEGNRARLSNFELQLLSAPLDAPHNGAAKVSRAPRCGGGASQNSVLELTQLVRGGSQWKSLDLRSQSAKRWLRSCRRRAMTCCTFPCRSTYPSACTSVAWRAAVR